MEEPKELIAKLLPHLDPAPSREGLRGTPKRYQSLIEEFLKERSFDFTVFANEDYDEMVIQSRIAFYSICEHHLLPFFGYGAIAYIPDQKIVGLSKLARTLDHFSHRLQNQERITTQVADFINEKLQPKGVGVILNARHLCMEMRGVQKPDTYTTTSCLKGYFKSNASTRSEFLQIVRSP